MAYKSGFHDKCNIPKYLLIYRSKPTTSPDPSSTAPEVKITRRCRVRILEPKLTNYNTPQLFLFPVSFTPAMYRVLSKILNPEFVVVCV